MRGPARKRALLGVTAAALILSAVTARADNPASGETTTGQTLNIVIDTPSSDDNVERGDLLVEGRAAIGSLTVSANVEYIIDVSGSTFTSGNDCNGDGVVDAGDNANGNGTNGEIIDCEIIGIIALNQSLFPFDGVEAGLIRFQSSANSLDVNPTDLGLQRFTAPDADADGNTVVDIEQAARTLLAGGGTNFNAALTEMNTSFATQPSGESNFGMFLSDGFGSLSTGPGTPLATAIAAGTRVFTFSVGTGASGCGPGAQLRIIADQTGGTCTEVTDPSDLQALITETQPAGIDRVDVALNGGTPVTADLDFLGNWSATVTPVVNGPNVLTATAIATDGTEVTADIAFCAEQGAPALDGSPLDGVGSEVVHDTAEPAIEGLSPELAALVHDLNCSVVAPLEQTLLP